MNRRRTSYEPTPLTFREQVHFVLMLTTVGILASSSAVLYAVIVWPLR